MTSPNNQVTPLTQEILPHAVYTTSEAQSLLKVSESTIKRLLKQGILRAGRVGHQYRILGKEILFLISPDIEQQVAQKYVQIKRETSKRVRRW